MSDHERRVDLEGIHIDRDLADEVAIEEDLDSNVVGPYLFPSPSRRRIAGWVYLFVGLVATVSIDDGWWIGLGLALLAAWQFASSWPLDVDEHEAMTRAATVVGFPVGHSSAVVRFHGWRSRPRWSVVMYSASEPPDQRALVVVDAVTGEIVEKPYVENIVAV
ncbi:MAG: hypothetical protein PVG83_00330 [Acidimicrobiia bacterium]|jgi:hypothetical protein